MENIWLKKEQTPKTEIMKFPEICIAKEDGAQLLSVILKIKNKEWGANNEIADEIKEYFQKNSLDSNVSSFFDDVKNLEPGEVDEETLYILALTKEHEERDSGAFSVIERYKPNIKEPYQLQQKLFASLELFKKQFSDSPIFKKIDDFIVEDISKREGNIESTKKQINELIDFFKPSPHTTKIDKVSLMPTDPLYKKDSGYAFVFDNELILKNHIDNPDNLDHEFSHSIINPIVEKISKHLSDNQKDRISELANGKLKKDYGSNHFVLLCEELIRTYNDIFKKGEHPQTLDEFKQKISTIDNNELQKVLIDNNDLADRFTQLNIGNINDLIEKAKVYFDKFEKNELREILFSLYQEYSSINDKDGVSFENFILRRLPEVL